MKKVEIKLKRLMYKKYLSNYFLGFHNLKKIDKEYKNAYWLWLPYLAKYLDSLKKNKSRILDVGCGLGHTMYMFKKFGFKNIHGIDINGENISFVKKKGFKATKADALSFLKKKYNYYDVICLFDVVEHFSKEEALQLFLLIKESLKNNGMLIIQTLNASHPFFAKNFFWDITHETAFTTQSLGDLLLLSGFHTNDIFSINGMHRFHPNIFIRLFRKIVLNGFSALTEIFYKALALSQGVFLTECKPFLISVSYKS